MLKVSFYFDNTGISERDCSVLDKGNSGIRVTEYLFCATPYELQKRYRNQIDVSLLVIKKMCFPEDLNYVVVGEIGDAVSYCSTNGISIIVVRN